MNRRQFLGAAAALGLEGQAPRRILVEPPAEPTFKRTLAARELMRGLVRLGFDAAFGTPAALVLRVEPGRFGNPEHYSISTEAGATVLAGAGEQSLLYAVFDFLERQGAVFGIDGDSYPLEPVRALATPPPGQPWQGAPRFAVRGLLPWPDFLNCITVYNEEDFRAYFEAMLRMRFNTFGMHVYTGADQWAESYLSFEYAGAGHLAFLDTTAGNRWGYLPQRTSTFGMGAGRFYDGEVFGSDATRLARDPWEGAARARRMLQDAFRYASRLGIRTGIGFEPYQVPDEIVRALPPEARTKAGQPGPRIDVESVTARDLLETRLASLLDAYPEVDYVWLWEDEGMNWASREKAQELSVTPFRQAHDFLRRHAPRKRLVLGGWGGVARNFAAFHKHLPEDVIFSCLSDSLGWDPVHEVFGKLEGRERWPIPWLEDDPGMWLPQFHAARFERDLNLAAQYGCQGVLGIHWRHRIVDPTAVFQSRFSWDSRLTPGGWYQAYAKTQAAGNRAARLASILEDVDRNPRILSTSSGTMKNGHVVTEEWSGDYGEAFAFWRDQDPAPALIDSQKQVAEAMSQLAAASATGTERERLEYLAGHIAMLVPYTEAWAQARRLHHVLAAAAELKAAGRADRARAEVLAAGVPCYLALAPEVRRALLAFQRIVATRNDLGTLASMQNKFVRLALIRLRLSIREYLGELPEQVDAAFAAAMAPDAGAPARIFMPTRPTLLARGEQVRVTIVATCNASVVVLRTRVNGGAWSESPARHTGRGAWEATLGPFESAGLVEYRAASGALATSSCFVTAV